MTPRQLLSRDRDAARSPVVWCADPVTGRWRIDDTATPPRFDAVLAFFGTLALCCCGLLVYVIAAGF